MGNKGKYLVYTTRDERIFTSLYVAGELTTEQIAKMYFPSRAYLLDPHTREQRYSLHAAEERLRLLALHNCVNKDSFLRDDGRTWVIYWSLPRGAYFREAKAAGRSEESQVRLPKRKMHHFKINDVYATIHPRLEELSEEGPEWQWKKESHAFLRVEYAGEPLVHQPDAEIHLPDGRVYFLERQTRESRKSMSVFTEKARGYRRYIDFQGYEKGRATVLWACDEKRDRDHAERAMGEYRLKSFITSPAEAANYLIEQAKESKWAKAIS